MGIPSSSGTSATPPNTYGTLGYSSSQSRSEKEAEYIKSVIPAAVQIGLQEIKHLQAVRAASTAAAGTAEASAASAGTGAGWLGAASTAAGIAAGAVGAYNIIANWGRSSPAAGAASGTAVGAAIGTFIAPGIGTAIGAVVGTIAGGLLGAIHTGKHRDQKVRDAVRDVLVQNGVLDSNYQLTLANGSTYDMGLDGEPKAELGGRRPFEIDLSNPLTKYAVSWMNPIIELFSQGDQKIKSDFVGYFANAALSNARTLDDVRANVDTFMQRFGLTNDSLAEAVVAGAKAGRIPADVAAAYLNGIRERSDSSFKSEEAVTPT